MNENKLAGHTHQVHLPLVPCNLLSHLITLRIINFTKIIKIVRALRLESPFWQNKITRARLRTSLRTGDNFSFNQCHNKAFCVFFAPKLIY